MSGNDTMNTEDISAFISEYGLSDMFLYANLLKSNAPEVVLNDNTPIPTFATVLTNAAAAVEVAELDVAAVDGGADQTNHPQPAVQEEPLPAAIATKTVKASGSKKSKKKRPSSTQLLNAAEKRRKEKLNQKKAEKLQKRKPSINVKVKSDQTGESSNQNDFIQHEQVMLDQAGGNGNQINDYNENKQVMLDQAGGNDNQMNDYNEHKQVMLDQAGGNGNQINDYNEHKQVMSEIGGSSTNDQSDFNQVPVPVPSTILPVGPNTDDFGMIDYNSMYYNQQPYYPVMPFSGVDVIPEPVMMPTYLPLNQVPLALLNSLFPASEFLFTPPASPAPPPQSSSWPQFPGDNGGF